MTAVALTAHEQTYDARAELLGNLDAFTTGYLECALWSSTDESNESGGEPLDDNYGLDAIDLESLQSAIDDCAAFQEENADDLEGLDDSQAGHDFWLTRNGHGAGFWDGDYEHDVGERLTKSSKAYGGVDLMVFEGVISGH